MKRIRIGLTSSLVSEEVLTENTEVARHRSALERAGADPIILRTDMDPLRVIDELQLQGIVFSGGGDISALRYGGNEALANDRVDPRRDAFEFPLMGDVFSRTLPAFAVCRGMQIANVLLGGTLIENILDHRGSTHEIAIVPETILCALAGTERVQVNSVHHQALRNVASGLRVTARADDGVIEAVEFAPDDLGSSNGRGFFIGVQWHPEALSADRLSRRLYKHFADACNGY